MTFLPIVARELRVAARRRATYWMRSGAASAMLVLGTWFFLMLRNQPTKEVAVALFGVLTGCAVLWCLLSGVRSTADCLSEEKREGTLGLLFLTDLKGYDVVIGKLAATSLSSLYGVLAVLPMLAVPLLMGGVSPGEFGRIALVAINTLFFSLNVGLCISAMSRMARKAVLLTLVLILLITILPPLAGLWKPMFGRARSVETWWMVLSPGFNYYRAWEVNYRGATHEFWLSLVLIHGLGWFFLGVASLIAPHSWQDKPAGVQRLRWRERWVLWSYGNLTQRLAFRRRLLEVGAFFWLAARARLRPAYVWFVLGLMGCGWVWGVFRFRDDWLSLPMYTMTGLVLLIFIKSWVSSETARALAEERQHGTLELLLSTPLTVYDILQGQFYALVRQFLGPVIVVVITCFIFLLAGNPQTMGSEDHLSWVLFWLALMIMLLADLVALYWVGLWQGLTARNPQRAAGATVARILVFPWLVIAAIMLLLSLLWWAGAGPTGLGEKSFLGLWFVVGLGTDLVFAASARHKLLTQFRLAASRKYISEPGGFWKRLLAKEVSPADSWTPEGR